MGLIHLLSIGLQLLTLLDLVARHRLAAKKKALVRLYVGNPKRTTVRPTAERLLEEFQEPTFRIIRERRHRRYHLTAFSAL
jgi:hypothetical protein